MNARNFSFESSQIPGFAEERLTDSMVNMNFMTRGRFLIWLVLAVLAFPISCNRRPAGPEPPQVVQSKRANSAETMTGRVVRIADGDTVTILDATNTLLRLTPASASTSLSRAGASCRQDGSGARSALSRSIPRTTCTCSLEPSTLT